MGNIEAMLAKGGWRIEDQRWIIGEAWAAYYDPLAERVAALKAAEPHPVLAKVIAETEREIGLWRENRDEIAYSLFVVRPA